MRSLKTFEEYIEEGIIKKQSKDEKRSHSLLKKSKRSYLFLKEVVKKVGIKDSNANNIIEISYDVIMLLIRSKLFLKGYKSEGKGAHVAEVSYLRNLGFKETKVKFLNQLRYFRNGILYYGDNFDKNYAKKVVDFLDEIYSELKIR